MQFLALITVFLILFCSNLYASVPKKFRWTAEQNNEKLFDIELKGFLVPSNKANITTSSITKTTPSDIKTNTVSSTIIGEQFVREDFSVQGIPLTGLWKHSVTDKNSVLQYQIGILPTTISEGLKKQAIALKKQDQQILEKIKKQFSEVRQASKIFKPELEIAYSKVKSDYVLQWKIAFIDKLETSAWEYYFNTQGKIIKKELASSHLIVGKGTAYRNGPKNSSVETVYLHYLVGDGTLTSRHFRILTESDESASSANHIFNYSPHDSRFDQVQAMYYLSLAHNWFKANLSVDLQNRIDVKVHVGGGSPSNAAFYYRNKIFLGAGDGRLYQDLIKDPTIVIHEVAHAYIDQLTKLKPNGVSGSYNEAFADYFAAAITGNPYVGSSSYLPAPYRRSLINQLNISRDRAGKKYADSLIVSGTMWEIRNTLNAKKADQLFLRTLVRLGSQADWQDFLPAIKSATSGFLSSAESKKVSLILSKRGWYSI